MGEAANKALMFGVGVFITVIIISGIMFIFSQMQEIYKQVGTTDTTITSRFGKYSSYDNTKVTGLEVINCANKYYKEITSFAENIDLSSANIFDAKFISNGTKLSITYRVNPNESKTEIFDLTK